MTVETLPAQELVRRAVIEVASLPEKDLLIVLEIVADLKRAKAEQRAHAAEIVARARKRAAELQGLPRERLVDQVLATLEGIRAEAVAKGTAIEGEWEGD